MRVPKHTGEVPCNVLLYDAARLVHYGNARTLCEAMSAMLPRTPDGDDAWHEAKSYLLPMVPDSFETRGGWWRSRDERVIGALLACAMAKDAEAPPMSVTQNERS